MKEVVKWGGRPPDQGAAPICANLIYALGMTRSDLNLFAIEMAKIMLQILERWLGSECREYDSEKGDDVRF